MLCQRGLPWPFRSRSQARRAALFAQSDRLGRAAKHVQCPVFFGICGADTVAPAGPTIGYAKQAPHGTIKVYEGLGHFDIYST